MRTGNILFPRDSQAGGTWFALHENGNTLVLLNGAIARHQPAPPYRTSRGLILLELADSDHPLHQFRTTDLQDIEPLTLVLLTAGQLHECCWDGARKYHRRADASLPQIWSSVTLYDAATTAQRKDLFEEWLRSNPTPDQEKILQFHQFRGDAGPADLPIHAARPSIQLLPLPAGSPANDPADDLAANDTERVPGSGKPTHHSPLTTQDRQVLTVSITSLHFQPQEGVLRYLDITGGGSTEQRLPFRNTTLAPA
jgi:hypothetical protein